MRRNSPILVSFALLLACGYASASAVESQHISAETSASSADSTATTSDRGELGDSDPTGSTVAPVRRTEKAKTVVPARNSGTRAATPRWHSFLPGMIR